MSFRMEPNGAFIRATFYDVVTVADLVGSGAAIEEAENGLERMPDRLIDTTDVTDFAPDFTVMHSVAFRRREKTFPNAFRTAIVATKPVAMGFARMFQILNTNPQIEIRIFPSRAEAEQWLAPNPTDA